MQVVVLLEPRWQLCHDDLCIGEIAKSHLFSFEGSHKALGHTVGLQTFNGRGHGLNIQTLGKISDLSGGVARAVIGKNSIVLGTAQICSKRCSIAVTSMSLSRIASIPRVVATQLIASWSQ